MIRSFFSLAVFLSCWTTLTSAQSPSADRPPSCCPPARCWKPRRPAALAAPTAFPRPWCVSPDGRYAALLNDGYGTQETLAHQSISVLDLKTNQIVEYPDARLGDNAHQSYFIGLAFSSDGKHLYASMGSLTDPTGAKPGDTGNGIAVYSFSEGKVAPERFIPIGLAAALDREKTCSRLEGSGPNGDPVSCRSGRDLGPRA